MSGGGKQPASGPDEVIARLAALSEGERDRLLKRLPGIHRRELATRWAAWAHRGQLPGDDDWSVWLIQAGRGFGKTRAGSEWVCRLAHQQGDLRIALVGATMRDVEAVMIGGESGLLNVGRYAGWVRWRSSSATVEFQSGARAFAYPAEAPDMLRGPEHHVAWCDELAKWRRADETWDNLRMGLRLGDRPRVLVTTTPRAVPLLKRIHALPGVRVTYGRTRDNAHLPSGFVEEIEASYAGTRLGRQELDGELIGDIAGALWSRALIERCRVVQAPAAERVVVGVDPPAGIGGDACGIVAVARGENGSAYVIEDASVGGCTPEGWARAVAACAERHRADRVVAEANQGGAMVRSVLSAAEATLPIALVHASRGKVARAEPVAALYERGRAFHVGAFPALEDELAGMVIGGGYEGPGRSPDRADALVWAMSELMLKRRTGPKVIAM